MSFITFFCYMIHDKMQWIRTLRFSFPRIVYEGLWSCVSPDQVGAGWRDTCTWLLPKQYRVVKWGTGVNMGGITFRLLRSVNIRLYIVWWCHVLLGIVLYKRLWPIVIMENRLYEFLVLLASLCFSYTCFSFVIRVPQLPMRNFVGFNNVFYVWGMSKTNSLWGESRGSTWLPLEGFSFNKIWCLRFLKN
jgi:hypothetical protein